MLFFPKLCKNIISRSCLLRDGYSFKSEKNGSSIYMNEMFYGFAPLVGGLFILDLECRLGHVGKKHMEKLHKDGVLKSFDIDSFDTCEACLMGNMIKTPF